jgi:phosphoribosyl-ATP pyrophosphohydrolase/phosphoribosyl-AMP cyclohydrolase
LLSTDGLAGEKVEEEAEEVVRAARDESSDRVSNEAADLIYHLLVLLRTRDMSLADALRMLADRAEAQ